MNSAVAPELEAPRERARKRFFATLGERWPAAKEDRYLRLSVLCRLLRRPVASTREWTEEQFVWVSDRIDALDNPAARALLEAAKADLPAPVPPPVDYSPAEVARIEEGLRECNAVSIRLCWMEADLFRRGCAQARAAGHPPKVELTRLAKIARVKFPTAERWELLARLVPEATRAEFPDLSISAYEVAVQYWPKGHTPTPAEVRERLILASDNGWEGPGLASHLLAGAKEPDGPHPSRTALEKLCAQVSNLAAAEVRSAWAIVEASVSFRHRKVAP